AAGAAGLLAAALVLVDGGPGAAFGLFLLHAALLVAFLDVLGLAFLLRRVFGLVALRHGAGLPGRRSVSERRRWMMFSDGRTRAYRATAGVGLGKAGDRMRR